MTVFDGIKNKNIDELAEWLDAYGQYDGSPWNELFDKNYCSKCESEYVYVEICDKERKVPCAWCELHNKCKYFQDRDDVPDSKEIIKMWLESEDKEHYEKRI